MSRSGLHREGGGERETAIRVGAARIAFVTTILGYGFAAAGHAQAPVRVGAEFQINTYTVGKQYLPAVDVESNGDFVVVWSSYLQGRTGVFGQRFASSGGRLGGEFRVNTLTVTVNTYPAVGVDADGDFVVVWQSHYLGQFRNILGQRFDSSGVRVAAEFTVNQIPLLSFDQWRPAVASEASGGFVVAWESFEGASGLDVLVRRFDTQGAVNEFRANTYVTGNQYQVALDLDDDGDFVVVWRSDYQDGDSQDGSGSGVFGQRFDSLGSAQGTEFRANHVITGNQGAPAVSLDADGDFVVVWSGTGQIANDYDIFARPFDRSGTTPTLDVLINRAWQGNQSLPAIALDDDGDFAVVWMRQFDGLFSRRFKSGEVPTSTDFLVNTFTESNTLFRPVVAARPDGDFVVVWQSYSQDGGTYGVFGQRFRIAEILDVDGNGQRSPLTDGLLMLRYLFGFTGNTLTDGVVGPGCTRCDSATIVPYLQQLP